MVHNAEIHQVLAEDVSADEMWSFALKKQKKCQSVELLTGDCWIGLSLATDSGLILAACVGKHTDDFLKELVVSTQGKTDCTDWNTEGWGGYERVLPPEIAHCIGKENTQRCSCELMEFLGNRRVAGIVVRTNLRLVWEQTRVTTRLVISYFNWIWVHSRKQTTAAQRAGLASASGVGMIYSIFLVYRIH